MSQRAEHFLTPHNTTFYGSIECLDVYKQVLVIHMNITFQTCMKGSPARARVVYAPVLEVGGEGRLVRACSILWNILWRISNMYIFVSVWAVCVFLYHFSIHFIAIDRIKASCAMLFLY
jgi:hypothetical protein